MEILQLKYFCDAANTQNFSKTAKKFFVPTSNISQSIKRLESELETKLFTRTANRVTLNKAGAAFYKRASAALDLLELAKTEAQSESHPEPITINIQVNRRITMGTIEKFQQSYPDVSFVINHAIEQSINGYDLVITDKEYDGSYIKMELKQEDLVLAYNKELFCFSKTPTVEELGKIPFVSMSSPNSMHYHMNRICNDLGFSPRVVLQSEDPFYIRKCIDLGLGVAFVPKLSWSGQFTSGIAFKSIGSYKRTTYLYQKDTANSYIKKLCEMLAVDFNSTTFAG